MAEQPNPRVPRLVLDTNVCLDLLLFADPRVMALRSAADAGELQLLTSDACRQEWRRVLGYPAFALDAERQRELLREFDARWICWPSSDVSMSFGLGPTDGDVEQPLVRLPRCRDPDDQKFLQLAQDCTAAAVLSRDRELLVLNRRCQQTVGFQVMTPADWIDAFNTGHIVHA